MGSNHSEGTLDTEESHSSNGSRDPSASFAMYNEAFPFPLPIPQCPTEEIRNILQPANICIFDGLTDFPGPFMSESDGLLPDLGFFDYEGPFGLTPLHAEHQNGADIASILGPGILPTDSPLSFPFVSMPCSPMTELCNDTTAAPRSTVDVELDQWQNSSLDLPRLQQLPANDFTGALASTLVGDQIHPLYQHYTTNPQDSLLQGLSGLISTPAEDPNSMGSFLPDLLMSSSSSSRSSSRMSSLTIDSAQSSQTSSIQSSMLADPLLWILPLMNTDDYSTPIEFPSLLPTTDTCPDLHSFTGGDFGSFDFSNTLFDFGYKEPSFIQQLPGDLGIEIPLQWPQHDLQQQQQQQQQANSLLQPTLAHHPYPVPNIHLFGLSPQVQPYQVTLPPCTVSTPTLGYHDVQHGQHALPLPLRPSFCHSPPSFSYPKRRRRLTADEAAFLLRQFAMNERPTAQEREIFAKHLKLDRRTIQVWFQNRRAKLKRDEREEEEEEEEEEFDRNGEGKEVDMDGKVFEANVMERHGEAEQMEKWNTMIESGFLGPEFYSSMDWGFEHLAPELWL